MCKILFLVQPWIIPVDADFRKVPRPPLYTGFFSAVPPRRFMLANLKKKKPEKLLECS